LELADIRELNLAAVELTARFSALEVLAAA
jgi:hypothetical protein